MAQVLAIEPDPGTADVLRRLVSERLNAEVVVVASSHDAIRTLAVTSPDLILTSSLLPADDGQRLAAHLRRVPSLDHLPILTVPPLVEESRETDRPGLISRFLRRPRQIWPAYDVDAVTSRIEEALEQSRADASRYGEAWRPARLLLVEPRTTTPEAVLETDRLLRTLDAELQRYCGLSPHQDRAPRWERCDLPWLQSIRLTWGAELRLLNLSSSGLLVESGIRMTLGNRTDFQVADCDHRDFVMPGRVVRSDVASVDTLGVKYMTAAVFEQPFESIGPGGSLPPDLSQRRFPRHRVTSARG